jgi:transcriptional regulator with XRE-family HTH domain
LTELLRKVIVESGLSLNQLSQTSGIDSGTLSRFMRGARTITLPAAERILTALKKRLVLEDDTFHKPQA